MADIKVKLVGNNGVEAQVNAAGELIVAQGPYDFSVFQDMNIANQAYNFYKPNNFREVKVL